MFNASRLLLRRIPILPRLILTRQANIQKVCFKPPDPDFIRHNRALGRPLSPCLSIYAAQMTSMLSFFHRTTGVALSGYVILFGLSVWVLQENFEHYIALFEDIYFRHGVGDLGILAAKFVGILPFTYHLCNGIRHLVWDTSKFMNMKGVYLTGYVMLVSTLLLNTAIALLTLEPCPP